MARILQRKRLVPNIHLIEVHAPEVARKCRPGQFVIIMPDSRGERIPLTIADWDMAKGSVTSVFMVVGTSTQKLSLLREGDEIPVYTGPLGRPSEIKNFGTVLCVGGCFGIAAIYPIARALKECGNRVISLIDVRADYLLYWKDKIGRVSDRMIVSSRDGGADTKDYASRKLADLLAKEPPVDRIVAVGCTYLMSSCAEASRPFKVRTMVSLNPIMVDGTGMCGACRVTVEGKTKFACVDGPDFDGHQVDWNELYSRRKSYFDDEIKSLCEWERKTYP
ncbi:MAG: sulfide/dihydroorotate dehydrogenase-like FAD/NAD-binding protein [Acidobacteriota bacterium]|nr:sulfide/dihydroorotate dehydrogenase-like FAD/NAD-binding protein [Acidobacteriota bacterium]